MESKIHELEAIYTDFEKRTERFKTEQACRKGCGFCCSEAGSIDITTLEGMKIKNALSKLSRSRQQSITKSIHKDIRAREKDEKSPCPFFQKNKACTIYDARPFSCRKIYSGHICSEKKPPEIHKSVMEISCETIEKLQKLDNTGYSGHISFVLHMLSTQAFLDTYLAHEFKPEEIVAFGKSHKIVINKMMMGCNK